MIQGTKSTSDELRRVEAGWPASTPALSEIPAGALAAGAARIAAAERAVGIHSALLSAISLHPFGARCAILEEYPGQVAACVLARGTTATDEARMAAVCETAEVRAALQSGRMHITCVTGMDPLDVRTIAVITIADAPSAFHLGVSMPPTQAFGPEEQDAMRVLARTAHCALRADEARVIGARRADRLRALSGIGVAVSRELDLGSLYEVVHREIARVLRVDAFYIALWDADHEIIHYPYSRDRGWCEIPMDTGLTDGPCSWVIRKRMPFVVTEADRGVQDSGLSFGTGEISRSALHVPMLLGDRVVGVMSAQSYDPGVYDEEDLLLFQMVAGQTAVAVENARLYRAVQELSDTDELTGLLNRRAAMRRLEQELERSATQGDGLSVLMLDMDHFKRVNDTYGHAAGDSVLADMAALLREAVRRQDIVARWGGEEFLIVLPCTDHGGAEVVAEHLRASTAAWRFLDGRGDWPQTISLGGIALGGDSQVPAHRLLDSVDACLYRAKEAGRNRAVVQRWAGPAF